MCPEPASILSKKKIMLCICGSIAAYKAASICSTLVKIGAEVYPVMTPNALYFINPITFSAISGKKTIYEQFINEKKIKHISLSQSVDLILIAPATANTISKLAYGICDNFLTTAVISSRCPVLIAPAMNEAMYCNSSLQENIEKMRNSGKYFFVEPSSGRLACGKEGIGRLVEEEIIISRLCGLAKSGNDLKGKKILITAGGTAEFIDSVRYISNKSSGKMGAALAQEAFMRGASEVMLVSAGKNIYPQYGVKQLYVESSEEMLKEVMKHYPTADITIMSAAVSDIIPEKKFAYKLKKNDDIISKLKFKENINILYNLAEKKNPGQLLVGFSAESGENIENSIKKIQGRNIDMTVLNDISRTDIGFNSDFNEVTIIGMNEKMIKIEKNHKRIIARKIWDEILKIQDIKRRNK